MTGSVHNEDCLETMWRMEEGSVDMILTSPPYADIRDYEGYDYDFKATAHAMYRILKEGGTAVWIEGDKSEGSNEALIPQRHQIYFRDVVGFRMADTIMLKKLGISKPHPDVYHQVHEPMFIMSKGRQAVRNFIEDHRNKYPGTNYKTNIREKDGSLSPRVRNNTPEFSKRTNVWEYHVGRGHSSTDILAYQHPAIMPEKCAEDHVISWLNPGDHIYDPFLGSGTTGVAAIRHGRSWSGSEISAKYCRLARNRTTHVVPAMCAEVPLA